jgi:hypothetical protein
MSNANPAWNAMRWAGLGAVLEPARRLASLFAGAVASAVLARAVGRAHRELTTLDDRTLADIGLDRAALGGLAAISERKILQSMAYLPWARLTTSA